MAVGIRFVVTNAPFLSITNILIFFCFSRLRAFVSTYELHQILIDQFVDLLLIIAGVVVAFSAHRRLFVQRAPGEADEKSDSSKRCSMLVPDDDVQ